MAKSTRQATISDHGWELKLIASPVGVMPNETVTLTVVLSHPHFAELSSEEYEPFYNNCFDFKYSSSNSRLLSQYLRDHTSGQANPAKIERMPHVPDGDYDITVEVSPRPDHFRFIETCKPIQDCLQRYSCEWPLLPDCLTASTQIKVRAERTIRVAMQRTLSRPTPDQALWAAIRNRTAAISFSRYQRFIDKVLGPDDDSNHVVQLRSAMARSIRGMDDKQLSFFGPYAYSILKLATQVFLTLECGVVIRDEELFKLENEQIRFDDPSITMEKLKKCLAHYLVHPDSQPATLPYLNRIVEAFVGLDRDNDDDDRREVLPFRNGILKHRLTAPSMMELIWSYWQEEGMLMQTINAIARRFQNRRGSRNDPLGELEFDSLRPLNNILWGYIQDEHNRLTVPRRAYEYQHLYGLTLEGKAVQGMDPADSRSKFIEAFHNLLYRAELFYREDRDTTMISDAFPLLNALKEVHLLLAEGAHNQFCDLTWTARGEMLIAQWMLARPEMREFLRGRYMVPYNELWMGAVDSMKRLQGWTDTSVTHFHELAVTGERILLSIRYGDWININNIEEQAKNWARNCKPEVQRYLHDYRTVTGVDLTADTTDTRDAAIRFIQPSTLLQRRLSSQQADSIGATEGGLHGILPAAPATAALPKRQVPQLSKRASDAVPVPRNNGGR